MVIFVVIGDGTGSFKTVNLEVFKLKKEKLFVLISITWYTDTLIPEVSYEPNFVGTRNLNLEIFKILRKKVFKPGFLNLLSYISKILTHDVKLP